MARVGGGSITTVRLLPHLGHRRRGTEHSGAMLRDASLSQTERTPQFEKIGLCAFQFFDDGSVFVCHNTSPLVAASLMYLDRAYHVFEKVSCLVAGDQVEAAEYLIHKIAKTLH